MKNVFVLLLILLTACSESEDPIEENLTPISDEVESDIEVPSVTALIEAQRYWRDNSLPDDTQMITNIGRPTIIYRVIDGLLTKQEVIFDKQVYQFLLCYVDNHPKLLNILSQEIPYMHYEDGLDHIKDPETGKFTKESLQRFEEIYAEENKIFDEHIAKRDGKFVNGRGWVDGEGKTIMNLPPPECVADSRWEEELSRHPFETTIYGDCFRATDVNFRHYFGDDIEVVIKHRFTYGITQEKEMLFVDVKRNISRPHIKYPNTEKK